MIKVENLSYGFPNKDLYNDISFTLGDKDHCAFIGVSGSGKSTLTDMIMHPKEYMFDGVLEIDPSCRIGYVSQFSQLDNAEEITVFEYIAKSSLELQKKIADICTEMETSLEVDDLLENYQQALDQFESLGGDDFESIINKHLNLVNLMKHKDLPISSISGGEFKLVQVIKEMLHQPDLMIMDEPDVFLDFENLNSLRNLINNFKGALLVITHNRYLLNHCFNKILHLENLELQEFDGRYIEYNFSLLEQKIELQELAQADTDEINRNEILINRLRKDATNIVDAAKGRSLKSRVKIQKRLEARRIKAPFVNIKQPEIKLSTDNTIEETTALKLDDYSLSFEELILENVSFEIGSTDKVALVGPNGSGKTSLIRDILNNDSSSIEIDKNIEMAYLSQAQNEMLNESNSVLQEFFDLGFKTSEEVISHISKYSFDSSIINQKIKSLSGGEKNLLQLAKISYTKANMLLLDEPTSHLDTYSQLALERALKDYNGAIIMISHDFYTMINSMDYVLLIEDKTIRRMNMRNFRKMIYSKYFDRDILNLEQDIKSKQTDIELALKNNDFELAHILSQDLSSLIENF